MDVDQRWTAWFRDRGQWNSHQYVDGSARSAEQIARVCLHTGIVQPRDVRIVAPDGTMYVYDLEAML